MYIYNSFTRKKEKFIPKEEKKVRMYVCGPTVYNYFHIGNARPFLFFDVVRRYFQYIGYETTYIQNITDIEDKIIAKAIEENVDYKDITRKYIDAFYEDLEALNINKADINPRATDFVKEMIDLIEILVKKDFAYEVQGDVYFSVNKYKDYGKLSGKNLDELKAGARIEANKQKINLFDFTLWKKAKANEPFWHSPWGNGRPGWHTECVVMSRTYLGETFDIHGGGVDLIFPHHENEKALAESVNEFPLVNYWMHNGFINIDGDKMSKSKDNFFTSRDVIKQYNADVIRHFFLSKHYRSPIDFSKEILEDSKNAMARFNEVFRKFPAYLKSTPLDAQTSTFQNSNNSNVTQSIPLPMNDSPVRNSQLFDIKEQFVEAMNDDFNTAIAIVCLYELTNIVFSPQSGEIIKNEAANLLYELGSVLGFFRNIEELLTKNFDGKTENLIKILIKIREEAKEAKNYALADSIRNELKAINIELRDTPNGTEWIN